MSKHTPGPWNTNHDEHDEKYQDIKIKAKNRTVATIWIDDAPVPDYNAEQYANATLIAAAPDLLASCEEMLMLIDPWDYRDAYVRMQEAANKAKGAQGE